MKKSNLKTLNESSRKRIDELTTGREKEIKDIEDKIFELNTSVSKIDVEIEAAILSNNGEKYTDLLNQKKLLESRIEMLERKLHLCRNAKEVTVEDCNEFIQAFHKAQSEALDGMIKEAAPILKEIISKMEAVVDDINEGNNIISEWHYNVRMFTPKGWTEDQVKNATKNNDGIYRLGIRDAEFKKHYSMATYISHLKREPFTTLFGDNE